MSDYPVVEIVIGRAGNLKKFGSTLRVTQQKGRGVQLYQSDNESEKQAYKGTGNPCAVLSVKMRVWPTKKNRRRRRVKIPMMPKGVEHQRNEVF